MSRRAALFFVGALTVTLLVLSSLSTPATPAQAQEPPPRPPTATPTTPPPAPTDAPSSSRPTPVPLGRITGTVIDTVSGAPMVGARVYVGGAQVRTDENGNYLRDGLPAGTYTLWLGLDRGRPEQTLQVLDLTPGATIVAHLFADSSAP